ncbi:MAG: hypothetical protein OXI90_10945, partial [Gammaproteobacteria bacterium]|nr:hypothetical protein [Gammaproteobacteria bacterium]
MIFRKSYPASFCSLTRAAICSALDNRPDSGGPEVRSIHVVKVGVAGALCMPQRQAAMRLLHFVPALRVTP